MEAHDDGSRNGGDWFALRSKVRFLVVAALAVGIALATPAIALAPKEFLVLRTPQSAKIYAQTQLNKYGWDSRTQWACLSTLWQKESNWRPNAKNHQPVKMLIDGRWIKFYAGGIPQRLGLNPKASVQKQVKVGLDYVQSRYRTPCQALSFWQRHYWY